MDSWNGSLKRCGDVSGWASKAEEWGRLCKGVKEYGTLNGRIRKDVDSEVCVGDEGTPMAVGC